MRQLLSLALLACSIAAQENTTTTSAETTTAAPASEWTDAAPITTKDFADKGSKLPSISLQPTYGVTSGSKKAETAGEADPAGQPSEANSAVEDGNLNVNFAINYDQGKDYEVKLFMIGFQTTYGQKNEADQALYDSCILSFDPFYTDREGGEDKIDLKCVSGPVEKEQKISSDYSKAFTDLIKEPYATAYQYKSHERTNNADGSILINVSISRPLVPTDARSSAFTIVNGPLTASYSLES